MGAGSLTLVNALQPWKIPMPIEVTLLGMLMLSREVQKANA